MTLKTALETLHEDYFHGCGMARILNSLNKEDADALQNALDNLNISASQISRVLKAENLSASSRVIQRHRNAGTGKDSCSCQ